MSKAWPLVKLGEVISQRKEFITIDDAQEYMRCRVKLHAKGIVLRDRVTGSEIKTKQQQVCRAGEFLVAEIDAKVGGFGIVPDELEDSIVSSHYFLFTIDSAKLNKKFLDFYSKTPTFREQVNAKGSTNYAAIRPQEVLNYTIPLPPLAEQQRIVAKIERLAGKIKEARKINERRSEETELLRYSSLRKFRNKVLNSSEYKKDKLGLITKITAGGTPSRDNPSYWNGNIPWIKTGELLDNDIESSQEFITEIGIKDSSTKIFPQDTILIALYGQGQTRGRTGRLLIPAATNQACCAIFPNNSKFEPRYIQYWLRSLYVELREKAKGGAQPNWNSSTIKNIEIALPPLLVQHHIVNYLDNLQAKIDHLKIIQAQTTTQLDALLPSILDKAFKGEL